MAEQAAGTWTAPHPVTTGDVDAFLQGAYDLHVHSGPDRRPRRLDAFDLVRSYAEAGFAGAVVKDHFLPTVGRAHVLNRARPDFRCFSTITLNTSVGGLNPAAVESALDAGVNWVIMPTVDAAHYRRYEGHQVGGPALELSVEGEDGKLRTEVHDILDLLSGRDVVLASGHLSPHESLVLFREAQRRGVQRLVVTHASIDFLKMPVPVQRDVAALGAYIEHAYVSCLFKQPVELQSIWWQVQQVGASSCYMASDLGQPHNPPPLVGWRAAVGGLLALGARGDQVEQLTRDTPAAIVAGIPRYSGAWLPDDWRPDSDTPS